MSSAEMVNPGDPRAAGHTLAGSGGFVRSGKVRDFSKSADRLLLVASDVCPPFESCCRRRSPKRPRAHGRCRGFWFDQTTTSSRTICSHGPGWPLTGRPSSRRRAAAANCRVG